MSIKYKSLDDSKNEIRLLELQPTNQSDSDQSASVIRCRITHVSQDDAPTYSALSYVWGDPDNTVDVCVAQVRIDLHEAPSLESLSLQDSGKDETVKVTRNLESALRHLSDAIAVPAYLWVDALCIDQSNNAEKTLQVSRMTLIFQQAAEVLVWLGPEADDSDEVVDILADIGQEAEALNCPDGVYHALRRSRDVPPEAEDAEDGAKSPEDTAFNRFVERLSGKIPTKRTFPPAATDAFIARPWWTRIWVIQEVCVASNLVFVCGMKRLSGKHCFLALEALAGYWQKIEKSMLRGPHLSTAYERELVKLYTSPLVIWRRLRAYKWPDPESKPALFNLLQWCTAQPGMARMHATDPRDRIFSLLGIAREPHGIRPDYNLSCEEVYVYTSKALLESDHFAIWYLGQPHRNMLELPSWVVDWSAEFGRSSSRLARMFTACGDTTPSIRFKLSASGLPVTVLVEGILVDRITRVGPTWKECRTKVANRQRHSQAISRLWIQMFKQIASFTQTPRKEDGLDEAIFRCSKYDYDDEGAMFGLTPDDLFVSGYTELMKIKSGFHRDTSKAIISYAYVVKRNSETRRCFVSESGYLGVGQESVEEGDQIVIFFGARIPFVIRERSDGKHSIIGGAYVDGIMNGELLQGKEQRLFEIT